MLNNPKFTRGTGFLENFLVRKRAYIANKLIADQLRQGKVLDIGCGIYPYFLKNTKFKEKYGIDKFILETVDEELILKRIDIENQELPYNGNFFDVIVMLAVIEHLEKNKTINLLKEIYTKLKPEGILIITTPTYIGNEFLKILASINLVSPEEVKEHKTIFSRKSMVELLKEANFCYRSLKYSYFEVGLNSWFLIKK